MMLKVQGLHVSYGKIAAVKDVSIEVAEGEIVALIGPNGAGKTTLLKTTAGLLPCSGGSILFDGRPIANRPATEVMRQGLALVLEGRSTLKHMTVHENLVLGGYGLTRAIPCTPISVRLAPSPCSSSEATGMLICRLRLSGRHGCNKL